MRERRRHSERSNTHHRTGSGACGIGMMSAACLLSVSCGGWGDRCGRGGGPPLSVVPVCHFCLCRKADWGRDATTAPGPPASAETLVSSADDREWQSLVCRRCLETRRGIDIQGLIKLGRRCHGCSRAASFASALSDRAVHCKRHMVAGEKDVMHRSLRCCMQVARVSMFLHSLQSLRAFVHTPCTIYRVWNNSRGLFVSFII